MAVIGYRDLKSEGIVTSNLIVQTLGGNQSNLESVTRISKSRLITARWPHTGLSVDGQIRIAAANGKLLSVNEP